MADSFTSSGGSAPGTVCNFNVMQDGSGRSGDSFVAVRHVPYANNVIIDLGGRGQQTMSCTVAPVASGDFTNLQTCRGDVGTLVWADGSFTAVLTSVRGRNYYGVPGWHREAQLEFLLVGV